ncbi:MAG: hypothetical protein NTW87_17745 [Planctomycetota bacterium]|nr:hypothetical protein [Planctomycetota bacterium]
MTELAAGDVVRTRWPERMNDHVNLYLGSGRCGACFDAYGLMNNGARGTPLESISKTVLMHADHWHRGAWGLDYWLPLGRLLWAGKPAAPPRKYRQELRIVHGYLHTEMTWPGLSATLVAYFNPARRDLLAVHVSYEAMGRTTMPDLLLAPETDIRTNYDQHLTGAGEGLELDAGNGWWLGRVRVGSADSVLGLRVISDGGRALLKPAAEGIAISFSGKRGKHLLLIGAAGVSRREELCADMRAVRGAEEFIEESIAAWHRRWGEAALDVPVPEYQALWQRSHYYVLASCAPDVRSPAAPMGWSGNGWPFHFPQDVSYIHPALLRLGHLDIARAWVEFYRGYLETMQAYTQRIYHARGAMWAWEFPIGPRADLLKNGAPNWFQFEIHNAAYPARMARETALYLRDPQWAAEYAWPVVRESARFLGSVLRRENDGTWGLHVTPSMGQDEMGGQDAKNYLCALFSARYCLQSAIAMAMELQQQDAELDQWRAILRDGLAFGRLYDKAQGIYVTCEGLLGARQIGKQKHPVQLNPLIFLPLWGDPANRPAPEELEAPTVNAYRSRGELCAGVRESFYHGWTLAAYWLAASHSRDAQGLLHDLGQALPGRYVDADWIQIYETSGSTGAPFYVTSHGLYLQALNDALVSDYWGRTEVGAACPDGWKDVSFTKLHTADGKVLSGKRAGGGWQVETA